MYNMFPTGKIDLAEIVTVLFTLFFFGLVIYLRREDRREGYPLEDDVTGRLETPGLLFFTAEPKTFHLHGGATLLKPNADRESPLFKATRTGRAPGLPLEPMGDPLQAAVGPGAYAQRAKVPDMLLHGGTKIAPLRVSPGFFVDPQGPDPVGMAVVGADGVKAGFVSDVWIDRAEYMIRYLEVALAGTGTTVLVPMPMVVVSKAKQTVTVNAVLGSQFAGAPTLASPDQITFDEEERVAAYYGGGLLYATPAPSGAIHMSDFNFEPIRGLPGVPPAGETILWQGAPDWRVLACEAFHIRAAGAYFAVMLGWRVVSGISDGQSPLAVAVGVLSVAPIALVALGTLAFLAWLNSRTTVYTITSRRVVMRFGAALSKSINIPFEIVDTACLKTLPGAAGDLALTLKAPNKIAFVMLWPHARPWKVGAPQPTLRCVPDVRAVAQTLATAMRRDLALAVVRGEAPSRESGSAGLMPVHAATSA